MPDHPAPGTLPQVLRTERLVLRAPRWQDGAALNEAIRDSLDDLRPWMPWAQQAPAVEESDENVRRARLRFLTGQDLRFHLFLEEGEPFVGSSGLHRPDWDARRFEIGYWVRTGYGGRGLVAEAVAALEAYAATHLAAERLEIRCDARNLRSRRVAERRGFVLEGRLRHERRDVAGDLADTLVYAKVRGSEF